MLMLEIRENTGSKKIKYLDKVIRIANFEINFSIDDFVNHIYHIHFIYRENLIHVNIKRNMYRCKFIANGAII